ncbi:MAG TPA: hypothetical protein DDW90_10060 [Cyanobacteria bacterium UBA9971]|nr:hypothetical protein [Cyanobacteria bacterium UBA9971]
MQSVKPNIFNYLTKVQKSDLCHFVASYVKKDFDEESKMLAEKFIEDQKHYLEINSTRFPYLAEFIDEQEFSKELELYIKECKQKYKYQEKQKPMYEKQKAYMKEQRKKIQESRMAKEFPTRAQISYYKKLCQKFTIENPLDVNKASKLDLRDAIDKILKHEEIADREFLHEKLNKIAKTDK